MNAKNKAVKRNQSVDKVFKIVETMANYGEPMRLNKISELSGIPSSTILRFLKTLIINGYAYQNSDDSKYSLTLKFSHLGSLVNEQYSIRDIARPFLKKLSKLCQESTCLAIEENMEVVYLDVVNGPDKMLKTLQRIGKKAPLHSTGVGKLLLLNFSPTEIKKFLAQGLKKLTPKTITEEKRLFKELEKIKKNGYALDDEECEIGARCIAAPIKNYNGDIIASISVSGPSSRMTSDKIENIKDDIIDAASNISNILAYQNNSLQ